MKLKDRLDFQKYFKEEDNLSNLIKKNIIKSDNIKLLFQEVCSAIINNIKAKNIETIFEENNIYLEDGIDIKIPNKFGTFELQYFCIISDIFNYFKSKKLTFSQKVDVFVFFRELIARLNYLKDNEIILIFNYLINILYILLEKKSIQKNIFYLIVKSCLPFDQKNANSFINECKNNEDNFLKINGKYPHEYNEKEIKEEDEIELYAIHNKIIIKTKAKYINWNLDSSFFKANLSTNLFSLCLRYPYNCKYNYFASNTKIEESLISLFNKMIKSEPIKKAMLFDNESKELGYIFDKETILKEFENNIHLVILPFSNYNGYTDKISFDIYLNIYIKEESNFNTILSYYESFLISKFHEYKHGSRIYLRIFKKKEKKTPTKYFESEIVKRIEESKEIIIKSSKNYRKDSDIFKRRSNEYGEGFEIALFGYKMEIFFLKSIIFCLTEKSWELNSSEFYQTFKETMLSNDAINYYNECKEGLLKELYNFFDFSPRNKLSANIIFENKSSNSFTNNNCHYVVLPRESHYIYKNENNSWR